MKRTLYILVFILLAAGTVSAQDYNYEYNNSNNDNRFRVKYRNIGFSSQKLFLFEKAYGIKAEAEFANSKAGAAFTAGRTYILHRNPIVGMIRIGLDATWFDINYGYYKEGQAKFHQLDIGMGVGPSVHVNPVSKLGVHTYFRYNPTFATLMEGGDFAMAGGYSSVMVFGGAVSWGVVSLGVEGRWGRAKYNDFTNAEGLDDVKLKTKGVRVYVGFRF